MPGRVKVNKTPPLSRVLTGLTISQRRLGMVNTLPLGSFLWALLSQGQVSHPDHPM